MRLFSLIALGYCVASCYGQDAPPLPPSSTSPIPEPTGNASIDYNLYGYHGCDDDQKTAILDALDDKHKIMRIDSLYYTDFQSAAIVDYLGPPDVFLYNDHRDKMKENLRNVYRFGNGWWLTPNRVQIFCGTDAMRAPYGAYCRDRPGHVHVVPDYEEGHDGLTFCDHWFDLPTLDEAVRKGAVSHDPLDLSKYENRARHWINALLLKRDVRVWPKAMGRRSFDFPEHGLKWMTTASAAKFVAKERGLGIAGVYTAANIDNWSWYALASYLTTSDGISTYPARPYIPKSLEFNFEHLSAEDDTTPGDD